MGPVSAPPAPLLELDVLVLLVVVLVLDELLELEVDVVVPLELVVPAPAPAGVLLPPQAAAAEARSAGPATRNSERRVKKG